MQVGGSLGGLSAGLALKTLEAGHDITILERNPDPLLHNQGAGIVAGGDTLSFFKKYVRNDRPIAVSSHRRQYLGRDGEIVHTEEMVQNMTSVRTSVAKIAPKAKIDKTQQWDLAYYLLRANFDYTASDYCETPAPLPHEGNVVHIHDRKVTALQPDGDQVSVAWETSKGEKGSIVADFVIGADGPSSTVRRILQPEVERTYAGYCALRGTVPEDEVSAAAKEAFSERFTFFHAAGIQILAYLIPGKHGTVEPGQRLVNFVYYTNFPEGSDELDEIMTDTNGQRRHITMPPGMLPEAAWEKQKRIARERLPPQFAEIVCKTKQPFVQAVTDCIAPTNEYMGGKVILVGDALAGFRPHTVASTSQACFDAMILADYFAGKVSRDDWKRQTMGFARFIQKRGADMGRRSQFQQLPLEEHIHDRNVASTPREKEVYPDWAIQI